VASEAVLCLSTMVCAVCNQGQGHNEAQSASGDKHSTSVAAHHMCIELKFVHDLCMLCG
jgi:hypothetical protein